MAPPPPVRARRDPDPRVARAADLRAEDSDALDQGRTDERRLTGWVPAGAAGLRPRRTRCASDRRAATRNEGCRRRRQWRPRHRARLAGTSGPKRPRARAGDPDQRPVEQGHRSHDRPAAQGAAAAENHDLERALAGRTPLVIGIVLALGFLLLLVALQAPLIAALGVLTNLLATGAAFGVARLIFQNGHGAGLLGFQSQGFLDAWGPVFFFAMIFAISMDYTVFLLSSAKEHFDRSKDPREASIGGLAHSGRVILAAAAVMVAVFFTFALSGPLPPTEIGVILGIAVLLDAMLIRLVLIPTLLRVFGRYAWALPRWLDRVLPDVRFGHGGRGAERGIELVPARAPTRRL